MYLIVMTTTKNNNNKKLAPVKRSVVCGDSPDLHGDGLDAVRHAVLPPRVPQDVGAPIRVPTTAPGLCAAVSR